MAPGRKHFTKCCCQYAAALQSAAAHSRSCSCATMPAQAEAKQAAGLPVDLPGAQGAARQGAQQARSTHESLACDICYSALSYGVQGALYAFCLSFQHLTLLLTSKTWSADWGQGIPRGATSPLELWRASAKASPLAISPPRRRTSMSCEQHSLIHAPTIPRDSAPLVMSHLPSQDQTCPCSLAVPSCRPANVLPAGGCQ